MNDLLPISAPFKVIRKDHIKAFLANDPIIHLESSPVIPGKFQFNPETDGILFEMQKDNSTALLVLDSKGKRVSFVDPVYCSFVKENFFVDARDNSKLASTIPSNLNNKWLDRSFSLSGTSHLCKLIIFTCIDWTNEESIDEDSLKKNNKLVQVDSGFILISLRLFLCISVYLNPFRN